MANNLGFVPNSLFGSYVFTQSLPSFAQIGLDDGKVSAPAIKFNDDSDTGIWSAVNDAISFTTAGTNRMTLNTVSFANTLPFYAADGTEAAPAYSFTSDTNTGIYRVGADSFGISTGGTNRLTLSTSTLTTAVKQNITNAENDVSLTLNQTNAAYGSAAVFINFTRTASAGFNVFQAITGGVTSIAVLNGLGNWLLSDGAAATPCYSFLNDSDTGLYSAGANSLGICAGGSQTAQFTTQALFLAGTAAAPSYSFINDTNTGIYNSAADTLNFATGGTNRISISTTDIASSIKHTITNAAQSNAGLYVSNTHATYNTSGLYLNFTRAANSAYNMIFCYANAVNTATLTGLGYWRVTDGAYNTPSYSFISSPTTGIYCPAASQIGFATGLASGEYVARITNDGIVGIRNRDSGTFLQCVNMQAYGSGFTADVYYSYVATASTTGYNFVKYDNNGGAAWRVRGDGATYADNAYNATGADYAEWFESNGEVIAIGSTVCLDGTGKIRIANAGDEAKVIGIVRPKINTNCCNVIGNSAEDYYNQKYEKDEYGQFVMESVDYYKWVDEKGEMQGYYANQIPDDVVVPENKDVVPNQSMQKLNPLYDPTLEYTPRSERDEWHVIGMMGQIPITNGQVLNPNWQLMRNVGDGTIAKMYLVK